jgi:antitoxin component of MazEF toxin-antitoxin module
MAGRPAPIPDIRFTSLSKSGHSRVINLPRTLQDALAWPDGCALELWIDGDGLRVYRARSNRELLDAAAGQDGDSESGRERRRR